MVRYVDGVYVLMATRTFLSAGCCDCRDIHGFGGAKATLSPSFVTTPAPPVAGNTYVCKHDWKQGYTLTKAAFTSGQWVTVKLWFYFDTADGSDNNVIIIEDGNGNQCLAIRHRNGLTDSFNLYDETDSLVSGSGFTMTRNAWNYIGVKLKVENSSSDVLVYVGNTQKFSTTGVDCDPGSATGEVQLSVSNSISAGDLYYTFNPVLIEDDGTNIDTEDTYSANANAYYVAQYVCDNTTTSDFGDDPDSGGFDDTIERPYSDSNYMVWDDGHVDPGGVSGDGPNGDSYIDNEIVGAQWVIRARAGTGSGTQSIRKYVGANSSETTDGTSLDGFQTLGSSFANYMIRRDGADADCPTTSELIQVAVAAGSGFPLTSKEVRVSELYMHVIHRNAAPVVTGGTMFSHL